MADTQPDQDPQIEPIIKDIGSWSGGDGEREALKARLDEIHIAKVSGALKTLADAILGAQRIIGERITELNIRIDETRKELNATSEAASEHSRALVNWTKKSVWTTVASTVITAGLLCVAAYQTRIAQLSFQAQAEPQVNIEIEGLGERFQLAVRNDGAFPVVDISIDYDTLLFWGPPWHQDTRGMDNLPLWNIAKLGPGEVQTHSIEASAREALDYTKQMESNKLAGRFPDIPASADVIFSPQLRHRMKFYREADRKAFQKELAVFVVRDVTGKPSILLPPGQLPYITIPLSMIKDKEK